MFDPILRMECTFVSPFKTFAGIKDLGVQINYCRPPPTYYSLLHQTWKQNWLFRNFSNYFSQLLCLVPCEPNKIIHWQAAFTFWPGDKFRLRYPISLSTWCIFLICGPTGFLPPVCGQPSCSGPVIHVETGNSPLSHLCLCTSCIF